jgi:hypothetical protein
LRIAGFDASPHDLYVCGDDWVQLFGGIERRFCRGRVVWGNGAASHANREENRGG